MAYTVLNLKAELVGILHGTTLNQISDIDGVIYRAGRQLMLDIDPQETKRIAALANPIFDKVYDYALPIDVKGNKVVDIRPQVDRNSTDYFSQSYSREFDWTKNTANAPQFNVQHNSGVKTIRISDPLLNTGTVINAIDSVSNNGTWTGTGATDLAEDDVNFVNANSSLKFNLTATGVPTTAYIENSTITSLDLSADENQSTILVYVYLPTASAFTSINVRWGNDSSNYWTFTKTLDYQGNAFVNGWNLIGADWKDATVVGTPDSTTIDYARISYTYDGTLQTAVRANGLYSRLGKIWQVVYYSKYLFKDASTNVWQETISEDSNIINLDTESYSLLLDQTAILTAQQQQGYSALQFDAKFFQDKYDKGVQRYIAQYKGETELPKSTYYTKPNGGYSRWASTRYVR